MNTCYIVGAGDFYGSFTPDDTDLVIAADGGYTSLLKRNIRCDLLIGDMDSLGDVPSGVKFIKHPVEKDETDSYLAYLHGKSLGYENFEIYGGVGGREDHTFANYSLLAKIREEGRRATLFGNGTRAFVIKNEAVKLSGREGDYISVFALGGTARGVNIKGLYYEAESAALTYDFPLGVSNRFTSREAEISVARGVLLIIANF